MTGSWPITKTSGVVGFADFAATVAGGIWIGLSECRRNEITGPVWAKPERH